MMKIALAVLAAAAVLMTAPANAQGVKMTQVDMQTGLHLDDRDPGSYRERRRYDSDATVGVGPGVSPSVHDNAATWGLPRLNGTTAAGSRAGSAAATKSTERQRSNCRLASTPANGDDLQTI